MPMDDVPHLLSSRISCQMFSLALFLICKWIFPIAKRSTTASVFCVMLLTYGWDGIL